ncbi:sugar ABC transporter ATP-binding protein [Tessaracoccus palaemonis]|uniref:Sugar ABC transporter ATP-binding protein n=1 Tax=Tessaracoccus palaemonis TaxID=2829499 RepID=A0ABX8SGR1_9ACTN|nr:sugar ABC transporter ATP-binding protein [Tessaracoccus palaemonis]QXT62124.1 sugar ABC transporter ATP-binding protein [Tessaracoccus palaemonis]
MTQPVLELVGVTVEYPGMLALDGVDIALFPGEVHALLGENGAGKSTVINVLNGVRPIASGEILLDGEPVALANPAASRAAGIATVFQDIHLSGNLTVAENVMLGHEPRGRFGIDWGATRAAAAEVLSRLGLEDLDLRTRLNALSPSTQQLVAVARAMVGRPRVLLLDEPTSSLAPADVALLFKVLRRLRDDGMAIVFVSHFLEQVFAISDRVTVLRDGRVVAEREADTIDRVELISLMLGRSVDALREIGSERRAHRQDPEGDPVLLAEGFGRSGVFARTDLALYRGEIVGFIGLRGSGRTELARLLAGVTPTSQGTLTIDGRRVRVDSPASGLRHRVVLSAQDRTVDGIIAEMTVADNVVLSLQAMRGWRSRVSRRERAEIVTWARELFGLEQLSPETPAGLLSGGQQQKILLARLLATRPRVLILDEPTRGVDIGSKVAIQRRVAAMVDQGMAVVFISSEFSEVLRLADRIIVLKDRDKVGEISNGPGVTVQTVVEMIASAAEDD